MSKIYLHITLILLLINSFTIAQESIKVKDIEVSITKVVKLGHSKPIRELKEKSNTSPFKRSLNKLNKKVPDNFKGRRDLSKSIHFDLEHQGADPLRQEDLHGAGTKSKTLKNFNGIGTFGSPHDPTGDVSGSYYVQMVNATNVGVFTLDGVLISEFKANTLWSEFSLNSAGDPIVLYDENVDRWILTEFSNPTNILIAVSDNGDPLGGYTAYHFSTPNFPDYPKYGLSPDVLTFTTNEEGGGELHNYFIDLKGLYAGDDEVDMQRVRVNGNEGTEAGFFVTTPVDWNGINKPYDNRPITVLLNDSSWDGGPAQDQIEVFSFDIDFINEGNTEVTKTIIKTTPFDSYPCSETGFGFACIPQKGGPGLDGVPEVIMNMPHLRNFGTHESMVLTFITDATNGLNISGIRWLELRRTELDPEWHLYQEGTFAPNDGIHRFLPSIAIDSEGSIGLAYNVSSKEMYVGARYTGRKIADPLGKMTIKEVTIVDGKDAILSGERFGDYSQMSVSPNRDNTFWWTSEYAGEGTKVSQTRIVAFQISQDSFDLAVKSIDNPRTTFGLSDKEEVTVTILNSGLKMMPVYNAQLVYADSIIESIKVLQPLKPGSTYNLKFESKLDLSMVDSYNLGVIVHADSDENNLNDTLFSAIRNLHEMEVGISGSIQQGNCTDTTLAYLSVINDGATEIDSLIFEISVNEIVWDTFNFKGPLKFGESANIIYKSIALPDGFNTVQFNLIAINDQTEDGISENNELLLTTDQLPRDHFITVNFTTDKFPEENGWSLFTEGSGELIASGVLEFPETTISTSTCVNPDSCFTFIATDNYGDGICCSYGNGNISISDNAGLLIVSNNGKFGPQAKIKFCGRGSPCSLEFTSAVTNASLETANDGIIFIEVLNGLEPYQFSIDGGITFQDSSIFSQLTPGNYILSVKNGTGLCELRDTIVLGFPTSVLDNYDELIDVKISPNPTFDIFKLNIFNLDIPDPMITVQILNLSGQIIQQRKINRYNETYTGTFSLMAYPAGTYLLRVNHESFNYMEKIIKKNP